MPALQVADALSGPVGSLCKIAVDRSPHTRMIAIVPSRTRSTFAQPVRGQVISVIYLLGFGFRVWSLGVLTSALIHLLPRIRESESRIGIREK